MRYCSVVITFTLDDRDSSVVSTITYPEAAEDCPAELDSHIIANMFPNLNWRLVTKFADMRGNAQAEVSNVSDLLRAINDSRTSPRDLFCFFEGYNSGYTSGINSR